MMRSLKRAFAWLMTALLLLSALPVSALATDYGDEIDLYSMIPKRTLTINYVYEDGRVAVAPYSVTVPNGSSYDLIRESPVIAGYTPDIAKVANHYESVTENDTITVTYTETSEVSYVVKHMLQNTDGNGYTEKSDARVTEQAKIGSEVPVTPLALEGFEKGRYDTTTVAADGKTVVSVYYDRKMVLMSFDTAGGTAIEPIYARYGASITAPANPTKAGYAFEGWSLDGVTTATVPTAMPASNVEYKALWTPSNTTMTVVFWYENADDDGYSYAGSKQVNVQADAVVTGAQYSNEEFEGRDADHFSFNSENMDTQTVAGDGTTVLNVYFKRNTYTLTFTKNGNSSYTIICGKDAHSHSNRCYSWDWNSRSWELTCGKEEHQHTEECRQYDSADVVTITAKYDADIRSYFPIKNGNNDYTGYWWKVPYGSSTFEQGTYVVSIDRMPGENLTFKGEEKGKNAKIYYYVETLQGVTGEKLYENKNFDLYKTVITTRSGKLTYSEEFHDIAGFTQWKSKPQFDNNGRADTQAENYLYYTRNSYVLHFHDGTKVLTAHEQTVQYEANLGAYKPTTWTPEYPNTSEKDHYVFAGWYDNPECSGEPFDFAGSTMPFNDLILYAKYEPKTYTVTAYKDDSKNEQVSQQSVQYKQTAAAITNYDESEDFIGWFYMDGNNVEHAFSFDTPITEDRVIYGKWRHDTCTYVIKHQDVDGKPLAVDETGVVRMGTTKTFTPKDSIVVTNSDGTETIYYPVQTSMSVEFPVNCTEPTHELIFRYATGVDDVLIRYEVFGDGGGTVDTASEVLPKKASLTPEGAKGSTAIADDGYQFVGWFDSDGKELSTQAKYVPAPSDSGVYEAEIYYAKFEAVTTSVTATKAWDDNTNQYRIRPAYATFTLVAKAGDVEVSLGDIAVTQETDGNGSVTWDNLPKYVERQEIAYYVYEAPVTGYTSDATENRPKLVGPEGTVTITNKIDLVDVIVTKYVAGSFGDRNKKFHFEGSGKLDDSEVNFDDSQKSHDLGHMEEWTFQVPNGITLTVEEENADGYETTYVVNKNEPMQTGRTATVTIDGNTTIDFTNTKDGVPDTGVVLDSLPYIVILAVVVLGVVLMVRKRRHEDD